VAHHLDRRARVRRRFRPRWYGYSVGKWVDDSTLVVSRRDDGEERPGSWPGRRSAKRQKSKRLPCGSRQPGLTVTIEARCRTSLGSLEQVPMKLQSPAMSSKPVCIPSTRNI
jgi:hypothetical protein